MRIGNQSYRTIWMEGDGTLKVIDQRKLPFVFEVMELHTRGDAIFAIKDMVVRGAPLIGVTAAWGMFLAARQSNERGWEMDLEQAAAELLATRPTAVNLANALKRCLLSVGRSQNLQQASSSLESLAEEILEEEVENSRQIGLHGLPLIKEIFERTGSVVNILTHCNAGWLACVDYGTATAPIYTAHDEGIPVHIWVDETRPRNQGARLTAFELGEHGIPHTVITDNAGGYLMQEGKIDLVIVGSDRTTAHGDVANKIGTYLKALAARDNHIPFYVALPTSTIDRSLKSGRDIEIEDRGSQEVSHVEGWDENKNTAGTLRIMPKSSPVSNPGFDVCPARLVDGLITEKGICEASEQGIRKLFEG